jgi:hypothetical protein
MLRENSLAAKIRAGDICDELAFEICDAWRHGMLSVPFRSVLQLRSL